MYQIYLNLFKLNKRLSTLKKPNLLIVDYNMSTIRNKVKPRKKEVTKSSPVKRKCKWDSDNLAKKLKIEDDHEIKETEKRPVKGVKSRKVKKPSQTKVKTGEQKKGPKKLQTEGVEDAKTSVLLCQWKDEDYLADSENLPVSVAKNIIGLFEQQNTIPFIARYRGHLTGELDPDKLRKVRETYEYIQKVHEQARKLHNQFLASNLLTPQILCYIQTARTLEELDFVGSQLKKGDKRTLAERARQLGLETPAKSILEGTGIVNLESLIEPNVAELNDVKKVRTGIQHIIADVISKTAEVHSELEKIYSSNLIMLTSTMKKQEDENVFSKYELYKDFSRPLHTVKPHQMLAINRGESEKELSVKITIPDSLWLPLKSFCKTKWLQTGQKYKLRTSLFADSVDDAVKRLLAPLAARRLRSKANSQAENEALCVFGYNLRQLLMTPPCLGRVVMGIDPGYASGCKVAVVSHTGSLLGHDKFFIKNPLDAMRKLQSLVLKFRCEVIALGNGCACREVESLLSKFIEIRAFKPLDVSYTIISEQGASIYSCSPLAKEEFPHLSPTVVGAVSLARRLQNPLSELVKVEPKHLGVGMYQHDVSEKKLVSTLDEVVSECVSFVGVDVNSASYYLLKRVAGLSASTAQEIIKYRSEVCTFKRREDLMKVKGIKTGIFRQCSGFLRVIPSTARCAKHSDCHIKFNPLDETCIHPESYEMAHRIMLLSGAESAELGSERFVQAIKSSQLDLAQLAKSGQVSELSVSFILDVLTKPKNFDLRTQFSGPIFRRGIKTLEDLCPGQRLEGVVRNTVSFGAFVDVGVGRDGLIHSSQMGNNTLQLNNRVYVEVTSVDKATERIQLKLISLIECNNLKTTHTKDF